MKYVWLVGSFFECDDLLSGTIGPAKAVALNRKKARTLCKDSIKMYRATVNTIKPFRAYDGGMMVETTIANGKRLVFWYAKCRVEE